MMIELTEDAEVKALVDESKSPSISRDFKIESTDVWTTAWIKFPDSDRLRRVYYRHWMLGEWLCQCHCHNPSKSELAMGGMACDKGISWWIPGDNLQRCCEIPAAWYAELVIGYPDGLDDGRTQSNIECETTVFAMYADVRKHHDGMSWEDSAKLGIKGLPRGTSEYAYWTQSPEIFRSIMQERLVRDA